MRFQPLFSGFKEQFHCLEESVHNHDPLYCFSFNQMYDAIEIFHLLGE